MAILRWITPYNAKILLSLNIYYSSPFVIFQSSKRWPIPMYKALSSLEGEVTDRRIHFHYYESSLLNPGEKRYHGSDVDCYNRAYPQNPDKRRTFGEGLSGIEALGKYLSRIGLEFQQIQTPTNEATLSEYKIPLKRSTDIEMLKTYLFLSISQSNPRLFDKDTVIGDVVEAAWLQYGAKNYGIMIQLYEYFLILTTVVNYNFHDWAMSDDTRNGSMVSVVFILLATIFFAFLELNEFYDHYYMPLEYQFSSFPLRFCRSLYQYFFTDGENVLDCGAYISVVVGCGIRLANQRETNDSASAMAFGTMLLWLKLVHFLRPATATGPLVRMIFYIMFDITRFLQIMFIVVFSFAQALYLLSYSKEDSEFSKRGGGLMQSFLFMMGNSNLADMHNTTNPNLAQFLLATFILISTILLLNLLIALMNSAYAKIAENQLAECNRERAIIITRQWKFFKPKIMEYQYYAIRRDDVKKREEAEERRRIDMETLKESEAKSDEKMKTSEARIVEACEEKVKASEDRIVSGLQRELGELKACNVRLEAALQVLMNGGASK